MAPKLKSKIKQRAKELGVEPKADFCKQPWKGKPLWLKAQVSGRAMAVQRALSFDCLRSFARRRCEEICAPPPPNERKQCAAWPYAATRCEPAR